jgi:hypothetical protein
MGEPVHQQGRWPGAARVAINQPAGCGLEVSAAQGPLLAKVADALGQHQAIGEMDAHSTTSRAARCEAV